MAASVGYEELLAQYREHVSSLTQDLLINKAVLKETEKRNAELEAENERLKSEA